MKNSISLEEFLTCFHKELSAVGLKIVLIRNYEKLPIVNVGNDIDIIVMKEEIDKYIDILKKISDKYNLTFKITLVNNYVVKTVIFGVIDKNNQLELDLNCMFNWRGVDFYDINKLVNESIDYNSVISIPKYDYISWYITFCHSFLYGGFINEKYINQFRGILNKYPIEFKEHLELVFGKKDTEYLINKINAEEFILKRYKSNIIRIKTLLRYFIKKPIYTLKYFFKSFK